MAYVASKFLEYLEPVWLDDDIITGNSLTWLRSYMGIPQAGGNNINRGSIGDERGYCIQGNVGIPHLAVSMRRYA